MKLTTTQRVLKYLLKNRESSCYDVGECIDNRRGRIASGSGGGDYAAQMMLGRMKKAGLVRTMNTEGSSRWELTAAGREKAKALP